MLATVSLTTKPPTPGGTPVGPIGRGHGGDRRRFVVTLTIRVEKRPDATRTDPFRLGGVIVKAHRL